MSTQGLTSKPLCPAVITESGKVFGANFNMTDGGLMRVPTPSVLQPTDAEIGAATEAIRNRLPPDTKLGDAIAIVRLVLDAAANVRNGA